MAAQTARTGPLCYDLPVIGRRPKSELEEALGYRFRDPALLERALTHRSFANEQGLPEHNERLEFLGDAILGTVAAEWLFCALPGLPEGELSKRKSYLVSAPALAGFARELPIGSSLRLGVGEERSGGREKPSLLADTVEAVLGAIFLDGGIEPVRRVVTPLLERVVEERPRVLEHDPKTRLQEEVQGRGWELPDYCLIAEDGPEHEKRFTVECRIRNLPAGRGQGRSKKLAEQEAAAEVLEGLLAAEAVEAGGGEPIL
jgi:ribonuclease-3